MKKFYLYFLMMFSSVGTFAKSTESTIAPVYPHYGSSTHYNSIVHSRLIAKSHYIYVSGYFVPADSVKYIYTSDARGGSPALMDDADDNVFFDSSYSFVFAQNIASVPTMQRIQTYQNDNLISRLTMRPWNPATQSYRDSVRFNYDYDANSCNDYMLLDIAFAGGWNNHLGYTNAYNASRQLLQTYAVAVGVDIQYAYDASGNMITAVTDLQQDSLFYDNQNRLYESRLQKRQNLNAAWTDSERWSYFYTGSSTNVQYATKETFTGNSWQNAEKHLYSYDANNNKLSDVTEVWGNNTYTDSKKLEWVYNSYNQPTQLTSTTWDGSSWSYATNDYIRHFYYESFNPLAIHDAEINTLDVSLYPVPSSDKLTVAINWETPQAYTVMVCDITGRVQKQYYHQPSNYTETSVPVTDLPSGTYFVRISGEKGGAATKKFVVTH